MISVDINEMVVAGMTFTDITAAARYRRGRNAVFGEADVVTRIYICRITKSHAEFFAHAIQIMP